MISNNVKRTFKVICNSNDTASFTGGLYNATFINIDLKSIIFDVKDFDKPYYMSVSFISQADTIANSSIDYANVYSLHIDMGKGQNILMNRKQKVPSVILPIATDNTGTKTYFRLTNEMQTPVLIQDLNCIYNITLNVINTTTNATFVPATNPLNYVCVLTFTEV